ncbi:GNAT family N-acetyltransferase [uncultured Arcobacter sp.]|uniref:GNAT family N-acetyltransferase n=1 Tax=uncultured Arcobacter sp. TaxID=165434 RepID=UPI0026288A09|nr:GNAT family N-acetyltransferase [uncultured Arcobacter sp.]
MGVDYTILDNGNCFIHSLVVKQSERRRGVGTKMLKAIEDEMGSGKIFIDVHFTNTNAFMFWLKNGFTFDGCVDMEGYFSMTKGVI